ncbi:peptide arginase family protein [Bacillus mycoides]|uniref:UPF0489 family protein n=1 Tax=Bacillus mycoides TaxID=1405 RepID=UPI0010BF417C|nr:UPF0489 family protein [Bacillus mycoides]TKI31146.1 hypothetical protein FC700_28320 [Bacillus mycoides]
MANWIKDDKWKVVFPEEKVFIMKHHNWAFTAWDLARDKGWIKNNSTLVHVDQHLDAAIDGAMVPGILEAKGLDELSKLTKERYGSTDFVGTDNFIWAGFARGTIQTIVYVSPEEPREPLFDSERQFRNLQGALGKERIEELMGTQRSSLEMLESTKERGYMEVYTLNRSLILDLDLDFFAYKTETETGNTIYVLKDESEIRENLKTLKQIYNWDIITVALSPEVHHIGGIDNALYVLNLFLEEFNLDLKQGKSWSILEEDTHK